MSRMVLRVRTFVGVVAVASLAAGAYAAPTALIDAIKSGNQQAARAALKQTKDVNTPEADGTTALHWAVRGNDVELARMLLRAGAKADVANRYGLTPLMLAAENGSAAVIDALLAAGANANAALPEGETVLMRAARTGKVDAMKVLIAHGATVDATEGWQGETALMWAAGQNHGGAVRLLVSRRDPGIWNWLDSCDMPDGLMTLRWAEFENGRPDPGLGAKSRVVKLADIGRELPDARRITPEEREAQRARRADSYAWRIAE